ncbi:MAG: hypothetical protein Q8M01_10510 [Rubrivivax sp.]|nr:hypothetical protein [Rubrivivax sp.]
MDFDSFLSRAWDQHAADAAGVAERLAAALDDPAPALVTDEEQITPLAHLVHHVYGAHLGRWADGRALLRRLAAHPACSAGGAASAALARFQASLALCEGAADERAAMTASDRIRVTALAAANLAEHDTARASVLFSEAQAAADAAGLDAADATHRALAVMGNNLAGTLEEKTSRTPAERELMIAAAQAGRRYWALAGTWLETERAEYRLAMTWLQAGDPAQARHHAQLCLALVHDNGGVALERFFGFEALALAERAAGNAAGHALAVAQASVAFAALDEGDRGWCQPTLDKLQAFSA